MRTRLCGMALALLVVFTMGASGISAGAPDADGDDECDLYRVRVDRMYGFIDRHGEVRILPAFKVAALHPADGLILVGDGVRFGYADCQGNIVIPIAYDGASDFSEGLAAVKIGGKWGYVDKAGVVVIAATFDIAYGFRQDVAKVGKQTLTNRIFGGFSDAGMEFHYRFIDTKGNPVGGQAAKDREALDRPEWKPIVVDGKYGFEDADGKVVIEPRFEEAQFFFDGLAGAKLNGRWGYIDRTGTMVIEARYDWTYPFHRHLGAVSIGGKVGYVNRDGVMMWNPSS